MVRVTVKRDLLLWACMSLPFNALSSGSTFRAYTMVPMQVRMPALCARNQGQRQPVGNKWASNVVQDVVQELEKTVHKN